MATQTVSAYKNDKLPREGSKTRIAIETMRANEDKPMEKVIELISKGSGVNLQIAKNYYLWCIREGFCNNPLPVKEPKPAKEPKAPKAETKPVTTKAVAAPAKAAAAPVKKGRFGGGTKTAQGAKPGKESGDNKEPRS